MTLLKLSACCRRRLTSVNASSNGSAATRQRQVQRDESTRQPFSAIHSVVKRSPSAVIRRPLRRVRSAWENDSVWVAFMIGVAVGPSLDGVVFVLAIIVPGVSFGVQITAAIAFLIAMLRSRRSFSSAIWPGRLKPRRSCDG
jgi:hypothetical protein